MVIVKKIIGFRKKNINCTRVLSLPPKQSVTQREPLARRYKNNELFNLNIGDTVVVPALKGTEEFIVCKLYEHICTITSEDGEDMPLPYRYLCPIKKAKELEVLITVKLPKVNEEWWCAVRREVVTIIDVNEWLISFKVLDSIYTVKLRTDKFMEHYSKLKKIDN